MPTRKTKILTALLLALTAGLFALTLIPGVWRLYYYLPKGETHVVNASFYTCFLPHTIASGILCGVSLGILLLCLRALPCKRLTAVGVLMEMAALLSVAGPITMLLDVYFRYGRVPSLNPEWTGYVWLYFLGAAAAAVWAFALRPRSEQTAVFSKKQMALYVLAIAAVFALGFFRRCWKWVFADGGTSFTGCYEESLWTGASVVLTAAALNLALLHAVGVIRHRPVACAVLLLGAAALLTVRIMLTYVSSDTIYTDCVPMPPVFGMAAAQLAIALRLLLKRKTVLAPDPRKGESP